MKRWIVTGLAGALCFSASAVERYVDLNNSAPVAPYTNWASAATDIQTAVNAASTGDVIWVTNGIYKLTVEIVINKPLTLQSVNGPSETIIDAQWFCRCLHVNENENVTVVIDGFTMQNGFVDESDDPSVGGAIFGVSSLDIPSVLTNCVILNNTAWGDGGGVFGQFRLNNCIVRGNCSLFGSGGGLYLRYYQVSSSSVADCIIEDNAAFNGDGGGLSSSGIASNSVFRGNTARNGGGMARGGDAFGCLFVKNAASESGGGLSSCRAYNCTITGNSAEYSGGMYSDGYYGEARNSIVYYNTPNDIGSEVPVLYSCSPTLSHGVLGNITNAPAFAARDLENYRLSAGSLCIDAGINAYAPRPMDLDGNPRIYNSRVDMGAYEYQENLPDDDQDGLSNVAEVRYGTNPNNPDSDNDGFKDGWEVEHGWSPIHDDSFVRSYIESNSSVFGYYTESTVGDLAMGEMMVQVVGTNINVRLQMMKSSDLINWTNTEQSVEWTVPAAGKEFFRIRAQP